MHRSRAGRTAGCRGHPSGSSSLPRSRRYRSAPNRRNGRRRCCSSVPCILLPCSAEEGSDRRNNIPGKHHHSTWRSRNRRDRVGRLRRRNRRSDSPCSPAGLHSSGQRRILSGMNRRSLCLSHLRLDSRCCIAGTAPRGRSHPDYNGGRCSNRGTFRRRRGASEAGKARRARGKGEGISHPCIAAVRSGTGTCRAGRPSPGSTSCRGRTACRRRRIGPRPPRPGPARRAPRAAPRQPRAAAAAAARRTRCFE